MARHPNEQDLERRGLWLSMGGALFMAILGIGFAVVTSSDAVLLDGLFSLVGCVVGLLALRVATLIKLPDDDVFHFGYAAYEPMLNLTKGLLMAFISLFALVSSIADLMHGGREVNAGWASVYAVIAASGCFTIALTQQKLARRIHSPLIEVDAKNWLIDGLMSVAVAVAFLLTLLLTGTRLEPLLPYADPMVVIVLVIASLPIPATIIRENWNQLIGKAPPEARQEQVRQAIASAAGLASASDVMIRMQQIGRFNYVQLYVICDGELEGGIAGLDRCRDAVAKALAAEINHLAMDVIFTRDPRWGAVSVGKGDLTQESVEATPSVDTDQPDESSTDGSEKTSSVIEGDNTAQAP